jgi:glycosyltransferase involved in cell wall biosynthesis
MTPAEPPPLVSIGLPVFNEAAHLESALLSLRAQTYAYLEIVVCDNASTDATVEICSRHAAEDPRVRVEIAERNLGSTANFRRALELARGEYFMWASGHDLWSPGLVAECVELLQAHPAACLAYGSADWVGPDGEVIDRESGWTDTRGLTPLARFFTVLWGNMHPVLGLMRTAQIMAAPFPAIVGSDLVILTSMALRGDFLHATASRWSRRELRWETSHAQKVKRYASADFGAARTMLSRWFPLVELPLALVGVLARAPIGLLDRLLGIVALVPVLALRFRDGRRSRSTAGR